MIKEVIYSLKAPYREDLTIYGYTFGRGEKSACIVGPTRGNEIQQLYVCSQLIKTLTILERTGAILSKNEIMVIPSINHFSMNIEKRFWAMDNSDINKKFPGKIDGETTERIAAGIFEKVKGYSYGIQFASFHTPGDFIPHVRLMDTGVQNTSLANLFGLPFVMLRKPEAFDYGTLNYNWQMSGANAFSVYTSATDTIDEVSANQAVSSVLRFLTRMGIIKYNCHSGYISSTIDEDTLLPIRADVSGIYRRLKNPGDEVRFGEVIAEVIDPMEGETISQILSPSDGIIFFTHTKPLVIQNGMIYQLIRRMHV
ncbi:M14 family metallopeptidase [Anaeromicropila populeti]|uniref:Succinylglutamate desuccinylase/Aspartoacylase catalytic domain-containing protein n=1 Tax=Anaeromicropila populeti TaxID=37658 RepID=A0A1I6JC72_9FIRM|nr:M14 family metallopeptidase [Anaeromicropila populeti]SFR76549.1 hypothetical protein SAMN05661086_01551 [Anaeromicropila populeti]